MNRLLGMILAGVLVAGCSSGLARRDESGLKYVDYAGEPVQQITAMRGIDSWTPVSRNQLVIWTGINEAWLLKVWDNCPDLNFANSIQVTQTGRSISRFERVIAGRDSCPIQEIRPVDVNRMKADRKAARDTTPTP